MTGVLFISASEEASLSVADDSVNAFEGTAFPTTAHSRSDLAISTGGMRIMIPNGGGPFVSGDSTSDADAGDDVEGDDGNDDGEGVDAQEHSVSHPSDLLVEVNFKNHRFEHFLMSL